MRTRRASWSWPGVTLASALVMLAILVLVMAWHVWRLQGRQLAVTPRAGVRVDVAASVQRLSQAVQLVTIATPDDAHARDFDRLHALLEHSFVAAHGVLRQQAFGRHALLLSWPGRDPQAQPIALLAHQDVVPVAPGSELAWQAGPYSGLVRDGYVWGRGSWDDKSNLMAIMEAVDMLARSGFQPRQTVYVALGADEEVGGNDGAARIARWLQQSHIRLAFVLDEGLLITEGMVPGVSAPVAMIGVAEKGYLTLRLVAHGSAGHTSMPPPRSAIGILGEAVARLEAHPMPARLSGLPEAMLEALAPQAQLPMRWVLSNLWLTGPLVVQRLQGQPSSNAMLRTTGVATVARAGERDNVLAARAEVLMNFRLLPGDRSDDVLARVREQVSGLGIEVQRQGQGNEASAVTPTGTPAYRRVEQTLRELQPSVVVAPGLLVGGSDSRWYAQVSDATFRFTPVHARAADLARFHGTNERLAVDNYVQMIQFYERLLRNTDQP